MVDALSTGVFVEQASRLGHRLATSALRHDGRATWLADGYAFHSGAWGRTAGTLGSDVGMGTAGVGMFLAHLAQVTQEARVRAVALDAIRHALARVDTLLAQSRFGWYDGALGVTGAATITARLLGRDDVLAAAAKCEARTLEAMRPDMPGTGMGLFNGAAGVLAGLLAARRLRSDNEFTIDLTAMVAHVASALQAALSDGADARSQPAAGVALGNSGTALALLALPADDYPWAASTALAALDAERRCFLPGYGWWCDSPHEWYRWDSEARVGSNCAWCAGAAGIGVARLVAYRISREPRFLAEGVAAIEVVRDSLAEDSIGADASVCHGWAGHIELLLLASSLLSDAPHLNEARSAALRYVEQAHAGRGYGSGLWPGAHNPSLLHGLAGVGLTFLRLHDPTSALSATLPACLSDQVCDRPAVR